MKNTFLLIAFSLGIVTQAQITVFEDDFESYPDFTITNFGDWVMYDLDGAPTWGTAEASYPNQGYTGSAIILNVYEIDDGQIPFNPDAGNYSIRESGQKYASFWCAQDVNNNNYLVTPPIDLTNVESPTFSFWAKSLATATNGFDPEEFEVLLSTTGNSIGDLTVQLGGINQISDCCNWEQYTYDLSDYAGNQVYIAIHHISTENAYALHVDDFKVEATSLAIFDENNNTELTYYPNPVNQQLNINAGSLINKIVILNAMGQIIIEKDLANTHADIDTSNLPKGVYYAMIHLEKTQKKFSFIKK